MAPRLSGLPAGSTSGCTGCDSPVRACRSGDRPRWWRGCPRAERYDALGQESAVQSWAAAQGYPAPEVLTVLATREALPSPVQVMERVPGVPLPLCEWGALAPAAAGQAPAQPRPAPVQARLDSADRDAGQLRDVSP